MHYRSGSQGQELFIVEPRSNGRLGSRCGVSSASSCPQTPLESGISKATLSYGAQGISLVRAASCYPRPLRCLPIGPDRYLGYRGGRRARSWPARTVVADQLPPRQLVGGCRTRWSRSHTAAASVPKVPIRPDGETSKRTRETGGPPQQRNSLSPRGTSRLRQFLTRGGSGDRRGRAGCRQSTPTDRRILAP